MTSDNDSYNKPSTIHQAKGGAMQKWEYLMITGMSTVIPVGGPKSLNTAYPRCLAMGENGLQLVTDFQYYKTQGITETDAVASFIAKLGNEGWELAGVAAGVPSHRELSGNPVILQTLYFKRIKTE